MDGPTREWMTLKTWWKWADNRSAEAMSNLHNLKLFLMLGSKGYNQDFVPRSSGEWLAGLRHKAHNLLKLEWPLNQNITLSKWESIQIYYSRIF